MTQTSVLGLGILIVYLGGYLWVRRRLRATRAELRTRLTLVKRLNEKAD
jgi:hypothetical protein